MSFYSDASLVMIPSGYKTSKVYSAVPTDGTGDLTFTRSNDTATRVNSAGLIEKVRTNLLLNSNNFSAASWINNALVTPNNQTSPDGTLDADTITTDGTNNGVLQALTIPNVPHTFSIYAKAGNHSIFRNVNVSSLTNAAWFNLSTGTTSNAIGGTSKIEALANGWYRCSYSTNSPNTTVSTQGFVLSDAMGSTGGVPAGSTMYFWNSQIETGDIATDYIPTTTAAVSVGPVANVPRLDYLNTTCPRLLLEPQRTNSITYSEQFNNAAWVQNRMTTTANNAISPDGYQNADLIVNTTDTGVHNTAFNMGTLTNPSIALSFFVKKKDNDFVQIGMFNNSTNWNAAKFNIETGTALDVAFAGNHSVPTNASVVSYGNGWYRISAIFASSVTSATEQVYISATPTSAPPTGAFGLGGGWTGATTENVWVYGAQAENNASYATSYIPTLGAAVTRGADAASKTGISSLIGQTEGTLFLEFDYTQHTSDLQLVEVTDGGNTNRIFIQADQSNYLRALYRANNSTYYDFTDSTTQIQNELNKVAIAYTNSSFVVYLNGSQLNSNTFASSPFSVALSRLDLGQSFSGTNVEKNGNSQLLVFKTRLTNAQLAELTA